MTWADSLVAKLRGVGVRLGRERDRLVVHAPSGVLTPELKTELLGLKQQVLATLDREAIDVGGEGDVSRDVRHEIAGLLAVAYGRYQAAHRALSQPSRLPVNGLALSGGSSVHGVVK